MSNIELVDVSRKGEDETEDNAGQESHDSEFDDDLGMPDSLDITAHENSEGIGILNGKVNGIQPNSQGNYFYIYESSIISIGLTLCPSNIFLHINISYCYRLSRDYTILDYPLSTR